MASDTECIRKRREFGITRLDEFSGRVAGVSTLDGLADLCIYVTGSYGRLEASEHSDLDLFFIHRGSEKTDSIPRISKILLDAELIRIGRDLGFPEFSGDGRYLAVHYIDDMRKALGSPADDFHNFFTARLLLLLESRPVHNGQLYEKLLEEVIGSYYRDYHDHESTFRPVFLLNDVIRFWRTLCLNYEHRRNRPPEEEQQKAKNHMMNLKLKFSRLLTCFSAVVLLSRNREVVTPATLASITRLSPLDRLDRIAAHAPEVTPLVSELKERYSWFLDATGRPKDEVREWILSHENRDDAFARGREFAAGMYRLVQNVTAGTDTMRFLVI